MDSIRPLLRISVVFVSLALMAGYVWFSGRRPPMPTAHPAASNANGSASDRPRNIGLNAIPPSMLLSGSKSAGIAFDQTTLASGTLTLSGSPTTAPSKLMSGSKYIVLGEWSGAGTLVVPPATRPASPDAAERK